MKTFYSIVYVTLNAASAEKVGVGLLLSDGECSIFRHSSAKLHAIKALLNDQRYKLVRDYLNSLEHDSFIAPKGKHALGDAPSKSDWATESYMSYLSTYANNLVQFSAPKTIDVAVNDSNFNRIFEKYIYTFEQKPAAIITETIAERIKTKLYPKINQRVNLDKTLDATHFENVFAPIEVNFIGVNGIPVIGQTIDFDKKHYYLENAVTRFVSLTKAIELAGKKGQYFVLGQEPEITDAKNHALWKQLKDSTFLEFVPIDEIERIEKYMEENDVKPYFSK